MARKKTRETAKFRSRLSEAIHETAGGLHPQRYLGALLCTAFVINTVLARLNFSTASTSRHTVSAVAAQAYMLGSTGLFLVTLTIPLRFLA